MAMVKEVGPGDKMKDLYGRWYTIKLVEHDEDWRNWIIHTTDGCHFGMYEIARYAKKDEEF